MESFVYPDGGGGGGPFALGRDDEVKTLRVFDAFDAQEVQIYGRVESMRLSALALCIVCDIVAVSVVVKNESEVRIRNPSRFGMTLRLLPKCGVS